MKNRMMLIHCFRKFIPLIICFLWTHALSQNIYDRAHSEKYAEYLLNEKKYEESSEEFERLLVFAPGDSTYSRKLLKSYILSDNYNAGLRKFEELRKTNLISNDIKSFKAYLYMLLHEEEYGKFYTIFSDESLRQDPATVDYLISYHVVMNDIASAEELILSDVFKINADSSKALLFMNIINDAEKNERKSPLFASLLSVIIPGSGKAYSDDFKNGIFVFSVIALYSWQSYRAFRFSGAKNVYTWIFGGAGLVFYAGNIYGSYRSAERFNENESETVKEKILEILYNELEF